VKPSQNNSFEDLELLANAPLVTGRYQSWKRGDGMPIRSTVGYPRFWRHGPLWHVTGITPYGVFGKVLDEETARAAYGQRLDRHAGAILAGLAEVARRHPGQPVVVLCFEDVHAGQVYPRRWFAEWFEERYGIAVAELPSRAEVVDVEPCQRPPETTPQDASPKSEAFGGTLV
jgi:hypothetical protein